MKFIGSGGARKAYVLNNGHCLKVAIPECKACGDAQNEQEAKVLTSGDYCCFPQFYKFDTNGLEVEDCQWPEYFICDFLDDYFDGIDLDELNSVRKDPYYHIPLDKNGLRAFAFVIGPMIDACIRTNANIVSFDKFAENILNASDCIHKDLSVSATKTFLSKLKSDKSERGHSIRDLLEYYLKTGYADGFMLADLWNPSQWGIRFLSNGDYQPVVIDAGFTHKISNRLYKPNHIVPFDDIIMSRPGDAPMKFNDVELSKIKSPKGASVISKFWTKSEYILTSDGMSRHIKHLGLKDDGLWDWTDKMTFMSYNDLKSVMKTITDISPRAVKVEFNDNSLSVQSIDNDGEWKEQLNIDSVKYEPMIGLHVCEFTFIGYNGKSGVIRRYHPGHDVTYIEKKNI